MLEVYHHRNWQVHGRIHCMLRGFINLKTLLLCGISKTSPYWNYGVERISKLCFLHGSLPLCSITVDACWLLMLTEKFRK